MLAQEAWEVVGLPAIADDEALHRVETVFGWQSSDRKAGDALHPKREQLEMLSSAARSANTPGHFVPGVAGRYQRHPHRSWAAA